MSEIRRRDFIKQASALGACACCFGMTTVIESCSTTSGVSSTNPSVIETPSQISIPKASFTNQSYVKVNPGKFKEPLFITVNEDGSYSAVRLLCTHKGCQVNPSAGKFVCPCHGSEFDLAGHVLKGPAKSDLQTFHVTTDEQRVIVHY